MNSSQSTTQQKQQPESENVTDQKTKVSASERATQEARKGEPLRADQPKDRSPKQENL